MAAKAKAKDQVTDFLTAAELARHFRVTTETITAWVSRGEIPPPWLRPGERTRLWRRSDYQAYHDTGRWPDPAWKGFKRRQGGGGS